MSKGHRTWERHTDSSPLLACLVSFTVSETVSRFVCPDSVQDERRGEDDGKSSVENYKS